MKLRFFKVVTAQTFMQLAETVLEGMFPASLAVTEENGVKEIKLYFTGREELESALDTAMEALLAAGLEEDAFRFETGEIEDKDYLYLWQEFYRPGPVGKLFINFTFNRAPAPGGSIELLIDPGMAFGTGFHPTTEGCLLLMQEAGLEGKSVLDVGSGTGVLSIAAALLGARKVTAVDNDPEAVTATARNGALNKVQDRIEVSGKSFSTGKAYKAETVVANLELGFFRENIKEIAAVSDSKEFVLSGILEDQSEEAEKLFDSAGLTLKKKHARAGWAAYLLVK